MIRAILMRLLGLHPIWEVRVTSPITGKKLPGTRIGKATSSYKKARALYNKQRPKVKDDHWIRLQAVVMVAGAVRYSKEAQQDHKNKILRMTVDNVKVALEEKADAIGKHKLNETDPLDFVKERLEKSRPLVAAALNVPEKELGYGTQAEIKAEAAVLTEHTCDYAGEMQLVDGAYRATCSGCGAVQ